MLLSDASFRVADGMVAALVGPNGAGKTTLLRLVAGDLEPQSGSVAHSGGLGVMRQFIGNIRDESTVHDLLVSTAPRRVREAAGALDQAELAMMERDDEPTQMRYAKALADWGDAGGYDAEVLWDACCVAALGTPYDRARWRDVKTLSGGEQKRLVLEALFRGNDAVLLLDEPDNYLDVPGKLWLEERLRETPKTVLLVSHDRELLAPRRAADRHGRGRGRLGARRRLRHLRRGPPRPQRAPGGAAPPLGRGARQDQGAGADVRSRRPSTTPTWPPATRRPRPGCAGSRRRGRRRSRRATRTSECACAAAVPASGR